MRQQDLFAADPEPWEQDAAQTRCVAEVAITQGPDQVFDYEVPAAFCDADQPERLLQVGRRVRVPFGRGGREAIGYCVAIENKQVAATRKLKPIAAVLDGQSLLTPAMLRLTRWMADHYLCPWGQVLEAVVPAGVRGRAGTREVKLLSLPDDVRQQLQQIDALGLKSPQQKQALQTLAACRRPVTAAQLAERAGCTTGPVRQLLKLGLIEERAERVATGELVDEVPQRETPLPLNPDQQAALDHIIAALDARQARGLLLHGVTGSGKTEVYLQAIDHVVGFGRQAIVLVPEISLTPQTVRRFRSRFDRIAVLHSRLTDVERQRHWRRIAAGEVQVVVGARSAVFAPTPHLGLIVIDEEHEASFKQDSAPRYHARDVAWQRAQAEGVPLVLGSATPALESWQRARAGEFDLLELPRRVLDRPMPEVAIVDLRDRGETNFSRGAITRRLHQAMVTALRDDGQVILLLNRRGFSTHLQCPACGFVAKCEHCDLSLTFHRNDNLVLCHYCDFEQQPPEYCPDCKSRAIRYGGLGTQKLEAEVRARFPEYAVARMDTDSMRGRTSHEEVLERFRRGEIRILLGTQMIAKGLDFPGVTLVGVVNADTALHLADFRASERTFQLVAQVAGRTGRGHQGGRVLVQTLSPDHPAIVAAARHDFEMFAREAIVERRAMGYPPYGAMARMVVRGPQEGQARDAATDLGERLRSAAAGEDDARILGPGPAPIPRLRGEFRFHVQLQAPRIEQLQDIVRQATAKFTPPKDVRWIVDIDPWDML
ncbi:MAG: primosomal protein N' [Planctomycetaceae bacterium]|nr:primosomal protein N' [Planctomycetaceae bacterium]